MKPSTLKYLEELRYRLMAVMALLVLFMVGIYALKVQILDFLLTPLMRVPGAPASVVFNAVPELFFAYLKITVWGAVFLALPILFFQLWQFLSPGLYKHERRTVLPALAAVPLLFYAGGAFAYFVVLPRALTFFLGFVQPGVSPLPNVMDYLGLLFNFSFAFGLTFNLPVVLLVLMKVGVLSPKKLQAWRRFAIVAIFIVATIVTPPDPFSQVLMAAPLILLYELAIWLGVWMLKDRNARIRAK